MAPQHTSAPRAFLFPGQGSQQVGMGAGLFERFPELVAEADREMGLGLAELCLTDAGGRLDRTQYTQPALYVVNALTFLDRLTVDGRLPRYVAGHSLGEYSALFAAGVFDFLTGLRLVRERARLMAQARGGAMVVVVGLSADRIRSALAEARLEAVDLANFNTATQIVISGPEGDMEAAAAAMERAGAQMSKRLNVSGAFHSRLMAEAGETFAAYLEPFELAPPRIPVLSNVTARPHEPADLKANLARQLTHSVRWRESVRWLLDQAGAECVEVGPGNVLTGLVRRIQGESAPASGPRSVAGAIA